ncbi:NADPH:quinone oxidoreductase family protein [Salinisphaera aquimarina]|uniref:NADPH:quinone oxidoreductase family protein n=1 Tax=Salinisphaera aquimarina TaxID=2094031 RepID=A0ABV7EKW1_9GAMM
MRAVVCEALGSYRDLVIGERPMPTPGPGQVRIRAAYASVSFAITLMVGGSYQRKSTPPFVPGSEVAGVIDAVADDVDEFAVGERVVAIVREGGYADHVIADTATIYKVPAALALDDAVNVPLSYGTAYAGVITRAALQVGETLLVHGAAGAIGMAAVQIGAMTGATVIATASTDAKCDAAREAGAAHTVNYAQGGFRDEVKRLTGGRGVDVVFDPVGGDVLNESLRAAAVEARIVVAGFASGTIPQVPANILLVKNISLLGLNFSEYFGWGVHDRSVEFAPRLKQSMATLFEAVAAGQLRPTIGHRRPLEEIVAALDHLVARRAIGKVVLAIDETLDEVRA